MKNKIVTGQFSKVEIACLQLLFPEKGPQDEIRFTEMLRKNGELIQAAEWDEQQVLQELILHMQKGMWDALGKVKMT